MRKEDLGCSAFVYKMPLRYRLTHPLESLHDMGLNIKYSIQRIQRGWCDKDTFDIDVWFLNVIIPMLKYYRDNLHGYPVMLDNKNDIDPSSEQRWRNILNEMISCFVGMSSYDVVDDMEVIESYKNRAFELFSRHFWDLWD